MTLLERETEFEVFAAAVAAASRGRGSVVLISGPAGIGKTALLGAVGAAAGVRRLSARAGELERELALGVARQLLEPALRTADDTLRARLLEGTGPAGHALQGRLGVSDGEQSAILHGIQRLVMNLAAPGPLLLAVDDVQWADAASLRLLAFLARRIAALPVVLALTQRTGEPATDDAALRVIGEEPGVQHCVLNGLSLPSAAQLIGELVGSAPDERFCRACHEACAGNPFVLGQLVVSLRQRGVPFDAGGAARVSEAGPPTVGAWVLARLERLPASAGALARAVAVLGEDADLGRAAHVAELALPEAELALDRLTESELLTADGRLAFVHPVVRAAVHDAMPAGSRSRAHRRAARRLHDDAAPPGHVATQLLASEPSAEPWAAEALLEAAHVALAQGAPEVAAHQALRALSEPPAPETRSRLLRALGNAERRLGAVSADERFLAALDATADPRERAETLLDLLIMGAPGTDIIALTRQTLADVAPVDGNLALLLRARLLLALEYLGEQDDVEAELRAAESTLTSHPEDTLGTRLIAGTLARDRANRGRPRSVVLSLATRAVGDDANYRADLAAGYPHMYAVSALSVVDELELAERRLIDAAADAERRGSLVGGGIARFSLAHMRRGLGDLAQAERDARSALELAGTTSEDWLVVMSVASLVEVLTETGELAAAAAILTAHGLTGAPPSLYRAVLAVARSALRLAENRPADAFADASAVGQIAEAIGMRSPVMFPWRSRAALALMALDRRTEAHALASADLAIAESADIPSAIGRAQRLLALTGDRGAALALLHESVATLEAAPSPLELARALADLGSTLRRDGQRSAARHPLARALELAQKCGARPLAEHARTELLATGARPRRPYLTGLDALTPSEHRVADLAAAGLTNAEIAARLYITTKTVEHHLASIYRKLDIRSRRELATELQTHTQMRA